jgi:TrmH family RNA methyltransferase
MGMLNKNMVKFLISLQKKRTRDENKLYVIEGDKTVREFLMSGVQLKILIAKPEFLNNLTTIQKQLINELIPASYEDLKKVSTLKTPHNALAVVPMPEVVMNFPGRIPGLSVALDCVQDPGNFGTIIRSAAWFGIRSIFCSEDCVDVYNSKVIQASMGAILNVKVLYTNLTELLKAAAGSGVRIYGASMDGESVYTYNLENNGVILLGNESKGISDELYPFITDKITIPKSGKAEAGIESLNVSMAASVIFSEFSRRRT